MPMGGLDISRLRNDVLRAIYGLCVNAHGCVVHHLFKLRGRKGRLWPLHQCPLMDDHHCVKVWGLEGLICPLRQFPLIARPSLRKGPGLKGPIWSLRQCPLMGWPSLQFITGLKGLIWPLCQCLLMGWGGHRCIKRQSANGASKEEGQSPYGHRVQRSLKEAYSQNSEGTQPYLIFDGELIFQVIFASRYRFDGPSIAFASMSIDG